nr:unnamed protein product [Callosobruchus analis]
MFAKNGILCHTDDDYAPLRCWDCNVNFTEKHYLYKHLFHHIRQPYVVLERCQLPPLKITVKKTDGAGKKFEIIKDKSGREGDYSDSGVATDALSTSCDTDVLAGSGCDFLDTGSTTSAAATGSSGGESPDQLTATAGTDVTAQTARDGGAAFEGGGTTGGGVVENASPSPLPPRSSATPSPLVQTPPADAPTTYPKIRIKTTGLLKESSQSLTITEITDDNPDGDANRGQNSLWTTPSLEDPLKLPDGDDNNLLSLFNNNESRAKDLGFHSSDSEFISLDRLEDRNRGVMTIYNPPTSQQNALESLTGLPMQALAQQVSRLQPSGNNGMHQQNVLINIQQFPSGPPQPQYQPPPMYPPPHHYPPQPMHQPYQYQPPAPIYYPPAPHGYPPPPQPPPHMGPPPPPQQMQHQQPPPMGGQQPPHQQQQPMPLPAPPVSQHQQVPQQGQQQQYRPPQPQSGPGMGGPRPQGQQPGQPRPPQMGQRMPNARPLGPRQPMARQRAPMGVRPRMGGPGGPGGMVRPGAGARPRGPAPANGIRPTGQSPVKRAPQPNNQAEMQAKKKRFDLLTPDKDDEDCQGGTEQAESSIMHLSDSITLSVRNPPPKPVVQEPKKSDAKAVANILATRGITVTASAKPKEKPPETGGGQKQHGPAAAPAPQQSSPNSPQKRAGLPYRCDLCPATYPNALGLSKHRQTYHKTTGGMNVGNVGAIGATSMLTLGPVRSIRPQMANGPKPPGNVQKT